MTLRLVCGAPGEPRRPLQRRVRPDSSVVSRRPGGQCNAPFRFGERAKWSRKPAAPRPARRRPFALAFGKQGGYFKKLFQNICATLQAAVSSDTSSQGRKRRKFSKDGSVDGDSSQNSQGSLQKTLARETGRAYRLGQGGGRPVDQPPNA